MANNQITKSLIRYWGAGLRETVASVHAEHGNDVGYRLAERFVYEIASFIAEVQGREVAADMCLRVGDAVLGGAPPGCDAVLPGVRDPDSGPAVVEVERDNGARAFVDERIAETTEWLRRHAPQLLSRSAPTSGDERALYKAAYLACLRDLAIHIG